MPDPAPIAPAAPGPTSPPVLRYITIHGHFYQPPRENPWLETVETQDSAAPYHDWNERITAECYAPNGASRIVNRENQIVRIINNYARISFNFGPTLLSWLEENASRAYRHILEADNRSQARFSGHGSAIGQVYNHIIMPLANTRDRITQIRWGIADFESRFRRKPEGMWLAETAVDSESLELLAREGILFTVLAPSQCARVRPLADKPKRKSKPDNATDDPAKSAAAAWQETPNAGVDTTHPYLVRLKSGHTIAVFFYDGPRSRAIAFDGLLNSGDDFANRLLAGFRTETSNPDGSQRAQLVHVATDGESYGHHHRYGEMALSYALKLIEQRGEAKLTNYGEFLANFPPQFEAEIYENTSWSCFHGVERWRSDCGCNGGKPGWNQKWRAPLRDALDWLRDTIAPLAEKLGNSLFQDVWTARDAYIQLVLARGEVASGRAPAALANPDPFLDAHSSHVLSPAERITALKLMEMQRHAMLMYTSCGWFFDDISGIETVQIIAYAGRVLQLAAEVFGSEVAGFEAGFIERLRAAKSNDPAAIDGGEIYLRSVKTEQVGLEEVAAHFAISSVFTTYPEESRLFGYLVRRLDSETLPTGRGRVLIGRALVSSTVTGEAETLTYAVLHFGDQNITAAVKRAGDLHGDLEGAKERKEYDSLLAAVRAAVNRADIPAIVRLFDRYFGETAYSINSLFNDEERRILKLILGPTLTEIETTFSAIYERHASLLQFLSQAGLPKPPQFTLAAGFSLNAGLRHALEADSVDDERIRQLLKQAQAVLVTLDAPELGYIASQRIKKVMVALHDRPGDFSILDQAVLIAGVIRDLPFEVRLWQAQNIWYEILERHGKRPPVPNPEQGAAWLTRFHALGRYLRIAVEELVIEDDGVAAATSSTRLRLDGTPE
jgi:alpha-amylase/alpha-mannosidase (GH57 family)